jgi:protoporphyrinogen oxidase
MSSISRPNRSKIDLFVGGSLSSLILAIHHKITNPKNEVIILDSSSRVGGDNGSFLAKNGDYFDFGMRVYYECNIKKLDDIVASSLPTEELIFLSDNKKDLAACYFSGKLQLNSPCLDLRRLSREEKKLAMEQIKSAKRNINKGDYENCSDYLTARFGPLLSEKYLFPILENFYDRRIDQLTVDASTAHFGSNERVILFEENETIQLMQDEHLRMRLAFPNQKELPEPYSKRASRGVYPEKMGMIHIICGLKRKFQSLGGKFIFNASIESLDHTDGLISILTYVDQNSGDRHSVNLQTLFWGAPIQLLARLLGYVPEYELERGKIAHLAHIIVDKKLNLDEVYYLFNFDPQYKIFRVANYSAYCPKSSCDGSYRATVEYWSDSVSVEFDSVNDELLRMGVIGDQHKIIFQELTAGPAFPLPSVMNEKHMDVVRNYVQSQSLVNVLAFGQSAQKHAFYTPDILTGAFTEYSRFSI